MKPSIWRLNWATAGLRVSPHLQEGLSHFLYMPFLAFCVCGAIYTGFFLPETKGKTFLEISEELHRLNFPRQSQGPKRMGPEVILSTEL